MSVRYTVIQHRKKIWLGYANDAFQHLKNEQKRIQCKKYNRKKENNAITKI